MNQHIYYDWTNDSLHQSHTCQATLRSTYARLLRSNNARWQHTVWILHRYGWIQYGYGLPSKSNSVRVTSSPISFRSFRALICHSNSWQTKVTKRSDWLLQPYLIVYILVHHVKNILYEFPPSTAVGTEDTVNESVLHLQLFPSTTRVYTPIQQLWTLQWTLRRVHLSLQRCP
jgi:hypothetical protein